MLADYLDTDTAIFSIRPRFAELIFAGTKTVELRRIRPRQLAKGSLVLVYESAPVRSLSGAFTVEHVERMPVNDLWLAVKESAAVTRKEFQMYFRGVQTGVGVHIGHSWMFSKPLELSLLRNEVAGFRPPQGFCYVNGLQSDLSELIHSVLCHKGPRNYDPWGH
jgi:predicted transcriptional regulator